LSRSLSAGLSGVALAKPEALAESEALAKPEARRRQIRIEASQVLLGHTKADVTQVCAERDTERATSVAARIG